MSLPKPYYQDDWSTIYLGDCREILPHLEPVDLVLTDPPYGVGFNGKSAKHRGGKVVKNVGGYSFEDTPEYLDIVVIPVVLQCLELASAVVITPGTRNVFKYPHPKDMGCFFSAAGTGMGSWGFTCMQPILYYGKDPYLAKRIGSRPNSCGQTYPNDANKTGHPCAKPIRMMRWLVNRCSLDGHVVLDPFMGSGTTLVAAKNLGRKAIGIEICERYCEIAVKRLRQEVLDFGGQAA